ncbi:unnamed protein product [Gemmataceae bacterium]|nr:unnamed protein product [Gemmataceae bacterium]VTU00787.1 unnamed protein product [Gemmataceae bacterium]
MPTVRLKPTSVRGVYRGTDGRVYTREDGAERPCDACGCWAHTLYLRADRAVCGGHVVVTGRERIRMTTTFACRVYAGTPGEVPAGTVLRRGDTMAVSGPPERVGRYDRFAVAGGFILVPRSRWAWE